MTTRLVGKESRGMLTVTVIWILAVLGMSAWVQGATVFYDGFTGAAGNLAGQTANIGGTWNSAVNVLDTAWKVETDGFTWPGLASSGGRVVAQIGGEANPIINSGNPNLQNLFSNAGTFYFTMLFRDDLSSPPTGQPPQVNANGGHGGIEFKSAAGPGLVNPLEDNAGGSGTGPTLRMPEVHDAVSGEGRFTADSSDFGLHDNEVHLLAMQIVNDGSTGADEVNLVLDPILAFGEPLWVFSPMRVTNFNITDFLYDTVTLSGARLDPLIPFASYDEIRVATTWPEVIGIPEPSTLGLLFLGGLLALGTRRR